MARVYPKAKYIAPARVCLIPLPEDYSDTALVTWVAGVIDALFPVAADATAPAD
jgi:hypothetical protein